MQIEIYTLPLAILHIAQLRVHRSDVCFQNCAHGAAMVLLNAFSKCEHITVIISVQLSKWFLLQNIPDRLK